MGVKHSTETLTCNKIDSHRVHKPRIKTQETKTEHKSPITQMSIGSPPPTRLATSSRTRYPAKTSCKREMTCQRARTTNRFLPDPAWVRSITSYRILTWEGIMAVLVQSKKLVPLRRRSTSYRDTVTTLKVVLTTLWT